MRYLGVQIPVLLNDVVQVNFDESFFLNRIDKVTLGLIGSHWLNLSSSLSLYFCSMPSQLKYHQRNEQLWQRALSEFIWSRRRLRVGFQTLCRPLNLGGLNVPGLSLYHSSLAPLIQALKLNSTEAWISVGSFSPHHFRYQ